jgi:hypothetical protein
MPNARHLARGEAERPRTAREPERYQRSPNDGSNGPEPVSQRYLGDQSSSRNTARERARSKPPGSARSERAGKTGTTAESLPVGDDAPGPNTRSERVKEDRTIRPYSSSGSTYDAAFDGPSRTPREKQMIEPLSKNQVQANASYLRSSRAQR